MYHCTISLSRIDIKRNICLLYELQYGIHGSGIPIVEYRIHSALTPQSLILVCECEVAHALRVHVLDELRGVFEVNGRGLLEGRHELLHCHAACNQRRHCVGSHQVHIVGGRCQGDCLVLDQCLSQVDQQVVIAVFS